MDEQIIHDKQQQKFYIIVEGLEGKLEYSEKADGAILDYKHTFVPQELRGRQIAQKIAKFALDYAKDHNLKIIPSCPFIKWYIEQNPEYGELLA